MVKGEFTIFHNPNGISFSLKVKPSKEKEDKVFDILRKAVKEITCETGILFE